ncbi:MAG: glycosyltransferase [Rhodothermales bacterium]
MPTVSSESPKNIILVGPASPYRGGIAHFLRATFNGLIRRGHQVEVVNFTRQYPALFFPGKTQYETGESKSIPSTRLLDSINPLSWRRTAKYMIRKRPEVVVFMHWMPFFAPAYGFIARRLKAQGIRVICLVHNALPHERRPGDRAMSRYFFKACDGFVTMSSAVEKDLNSLGARGRKLVVGHPVYESFGDAVPQEEARSRLGLRTDVPVLLFFGFVRRYKGLKVLLDSMPAVVKNLPNVRLVVAGECYEDEQQYKDFITQNELAAHVILKFEYIPEKDISDLFSSADVVVQPYISATQSGVAQIAYHFDRSLIVTDVGGLAEIVPHEQAGLVVPPEDPKALATAIIRFFEEDMRPQLQAGVLEEKKKYSWDQLLEAIEQLVGP